MNTQTKKPSFWSSVNPLLNDKRFYQHWISISLPFFVLTLSTIVTKLVSHVSQNSEHIVLYYTFTLMTFMLWTKTRKFVYVKRSWWQSFLMYGVFWCIVSIMSILAVLIVKHFELAQQSTYIRRFRKDAPFFFNKANQRARLWRAL